MSKPRGLSGLVCIRNGFDLDYCWQEAVQSLLPVCDEVVVCDGESADGTQEFVRGWSRKEPKIKVCVYPWPSPVGNISFWVEWLQYGRQHCSFDRLCQLDGDEILCEWSYPQVLDFAKREGRFSVWCNRLNFWSDTKHLIPHGHCLGHRVVRIAPEDIFLPSDGNDPRGNECVGMAVDSSIDIAHYGFLRLRDAYFKKSRDLLKMFFNARDPRLDAFEACKGNWMTAPGILEWQNNLVAYNGPHPAVAKAWLKERGYDCDGHLTVDRFK